MVPHRDDDPIKDALERLSAEAQTIVEQYGAAIARYHADLEKLLGGTDA